MSEAVEQMGVLLTLKDYWDFQMVEADPRVRFQVQPLPLLDRKISEFLAVGSEAIGLWLGTISKDWTPGLPDELSQSDLLLLSKYGAIQLRYYSIPQVWSRFSSLSDEEAILVFYSMQDYSEIPVEHFADVLIRAHTQKLISESVWTDTPETRRLAVEFLTNFNHLMGSRTAEEVDKVVWGLLGTPFDLAWNVQNDWDKDEIIGEVIRAMVYPFQDWLNHQPHDVFDIGFNMWWDMVLPYKTAVRSLPCVLEVLSQILDLDHPSCVGAALHGVNHLGTREEREAVLLPYFDKMQFSGAERAEYEDILSGSNM